MQAGSSCDNTFETATRKCNSTFNDLNTVMCDYSESYEEDCTLQVTAPASMSTNIHCMVGDDGPQSVARLSGLIVACTCKYIFQKQQNGICLNAPNLLDIKLLQLIYLNNPIGEILQIQSRINIIIITMIYQLIWTLYIVLLYKAFTYRLHNIMEAWKQLDWN